jgi:hypothetical protein
MSRMNKTDRGNDAMRITDQYRTRDGMAYELREKGARLTILIAERPNGDGREWHVEASSSQNPETNISQVATTRAEALRRMALEWTTDSAARGLPSFDWEAVARALSVVRAI